MTTINRTFANAAQPPATLRRSATSVHPLLVLTLILVVAAALRLTGLDREGRWGDEYFQTMQYDQSPWYVVLGARTNNQPPLDYLIGWAITKIARTTWMMRLPAACFGIAGVGMLFVLVRRMFGTGAALLAAALLAVAPLHWKLSQEARPYTIFVFMMLLTLWCFVRALEKPSWRRVLGYGLSASLMILSRGLAPHVVVLCCGVVLSACWLMNPRGSDLRQTCGRIWIMTVLVGLAGAGLLAFLLQADAGWTVFTPDGAANASGISRVVDTLARNVAIWWYAPNALFGRGSLPVMVLAVLGAVWCVLRWRDLSPPVRCALMVLWIIGPAYLVVYSAAVAQNPICDRYALFLTPVVVTFAAMMLVELLRQAFSTGGNRRTRVAGVLIVGSLIMLPAASTLAMSRQYFHPDWRGSVAYLRHSYGPGDVVMVFTDRPLGSGAAPYWGKHDWPNADPPLGEAMWTLATSEAHWQRLVAQSGRCCVVLKYAVGQQWASEYVDRGLQAPPEAARLTKFRGLDVLEGFAGADIASRVIAACNTVLSLPREHDDSKAVAYLLRSRCELLRGQPEEAQASYAAAVECVSPEQQAWFAKVTQTHHQALTAGNAH